MKVILAENEDAEKFFSDLANRVGESVVKQITTMLKEIQKDSKKQDEDLWVGRERAKQILGIRSKKKMQFIRDNNLIKITRHGRTIMYYVPSLYEFLEKNVQT